MKGQAENSEFAQVAALSDEARRAINAWYRAEEPAALEFLRARLDYPRDLRERIARRAGALVAQMRGHGAGRGGLDAFLQEYDLSSREGVMLMCLAEALLRVPDADTANRLIEDKLLGANWEEHLGDSGSVFVNASTWALMLTGRLMELGADGAADLGGVLGRLVARSGEPVIRQALTRAMRILGRQFVMGRSIEEALRRAREQEARGYRYSYDMLGEAALSAADAERYFEGYRSAIQAIGKAAGGRGPVAGPGISVKLSALHPRLELAQRERVLGELGERLAELALAAKGADIGLCVDAEEAERLDLSLDLIAAVAARPELAGWDGFGLAVQAYQKRALAVIDWLAERARADRRRLMVRLVKGAYWDTEIKRAQERGLDGYPVFTRKINTDTSFIACAQRLLAEPRAFYPQFATHNAHTLAAVQELAGQRGDYEFQRLHGMGEGLYDPLVTGRDGDGIECRIYAPVGGHEDLLSYLVRRLLENGSNTSFVNRIVHEELAIEELVADPVTRVERLERAAHPRIPLPRALYGPARPNSRGLDLSDQEVLHALAADMARAAEGSWTAAPIIGGKRAVGAARPVRSPAEVKRTVGTVIEAGEAQVAEALLRAHAAAPSWDRTPAARRAEILGAAADLLEERCAEFMTLAVREAGKTLPDALAEVREAVDFCRYYAEQARGLFGAPEALPGPTGESNELQLHGRGVFACISPWNFPLAIFIGQVGAALAAGNAALAKPAEQTPLIAARAVELLHAAGVPHDVLQLLPGPGASVGARLVADERVGGVVFTGSTDTARSINAALAARPGPIVPLIAETGGQNAMIVDSTALPEQVVVDVVNSAFRSAGQRCSALRVLFLQEEIAPRVLEMLAGAMRELVVGDPARLATDVGPVIDAEALAALEAHAERVRREGRVICALRLPEKLPEGHYFAPLAVEIDGMEQLEREVFGPILHVVRYPGEALDAVVDAINACGYGLTLGIHTRIDRRARALQGRLRVGNTYVNRNMIGAVVGSQPFGGEGLSGTGPKAGGPHYLLRFATERTLSINTTAAGGNASLISLQDGE